MIHLDPLIREYGLELWNDNEILPGEEWDAVIKENLSKADVILLLLSPDAMASEYIQTVEIQEAMQQHELGNTYVIPIVIRSCIWEGLKLSKLNIPLEGKPISSFSNQDEAWVETVQSLRRIF